VRFRHASPLLGEAQRLHLAAQHVELVLRGDHVRSARHFADDRGVGHARAVPAHLARRHELLEDVDDGRHVLGAGEPVMDQVDVDAVGVEAAQARVARAPQVLGAEVAAAAGPRLLVEDVADLGDDHDVVAPPGERPAEHALAVAAAVDVGGIEERDAEVERVPDRADGLLVVHVAPACGPAVEGPWAADRPAAEAEGADLLCSPSAEIALEHAVSKARAATGIQ
jgi:hypothetical protein